ncbi:MAG: BadF/BadG/BcrA/BcrD ATPase family protein [Roseinatronobacter sp.]
MRFFIGLDGGGSGCRAQAELEDGRRTQVVAGGAANVHSDMARAVEAISETLSAVVGMVHDLCPDTRSVVPRVVLGLAGASETDAADRLKTALAVEELTVLGDVNIAVKGAFKEDDGIVMAIGTGSVLARQSGGAFHRLGGYGFSLGDEGSGAWIGREALRRSLHARDGLGVDGLLVQHLWQRFGTTAEFIAFAGRARPADYARLAPDVLRFDRAFCPVAAAILDEGCGYLLSAIRALQEGIWDMPVAATGGLGPSMLDRITSQGGAHLCRVSSKGTALDGALWYARTNFIQKDVH